MENGKLFFCFAVFLLLRKHPTAWLIGLKEIFVKKDYEESVKNKILFERSEFYLV